MLAIVLDCQPDHEDLNRRLALLFLLRCMREAAMSVARYKRNSMAMFPPTYPNKCIVAHSQRIRSLVAARIPCVDGRHSAGIRRHERRKRENNDGRRRRGAL